MSYRPHARGWSRTAATAALLLAVAGCGSTPAETASAPASPTAGRTSAPTPTPTSSGEPSGRRLVAGQDAWVSVSVARLWQSPAAPRSVDAPALERPVRFRAWLRAMTLTQRRALDEHSDSEALLGDRVVVLRLRPGWARVVVPSQPTPKDRRGYPGWVPRRQLTATAPARTAQVATVTARTAWMRSDDAAAQRRTEISFGTRLPVLGRSGGYARVVMPRGAVRRLPLADVVVHDRGTAALAPSRAGLVSTALSFRGLQYLWGGLSGFGLDCSGLTWLDHRVHGRRIPRDAAPQSQHGRAVGTLRPGDLLFYANAGRVHHVTMYVGDGRIVHAPRTGEPVQVAPFAEQPLRGEYVGARRYLP